MTGVARQCYLEEHVVVGDLAGSLAGGRPRPDHRHPRSGRAEYRFVAARGETAVAGAHRNTRPEYERRNKRDLTRRQNLFFAFIYNTIGVPVAARSSACSLAP
jgi:hypothetical protein